MQIDPLADDYGDLTPYHYAANDPIGNADEDGLSVISALGQVACWSGQSAAMVSMLNTLKAVGSAIGLASNFINIGGNVAKIVNQATLQSQINGSVKTKGVGDDNVPDDKYSLRNLPNQKPYDYDSWNSVDKSVYKVFGLKPKKYKTPNDDNGENEGDIAMKLQDKYKNYKYKSPPDGNCTTDCSDFTERVAKQKGYKLKPEGHYGNSKAVGQANWYKNHGKWITNLKEAKKGDHIFWDRGTDDDVLYHTGIVSKVDADGTIWVTQSQFHKGQPPTIFTNRLNSQGQMRGFLKSDKKTAQTFVGFGRYP